MTLMVSPERQLLLQLHFGVGRLPALSFLCNTISLHWFILALIFDLNQQCELDFFVWAGKGLLSFASV